MRAIRFLFDYVSPYAYLAWTQVHALAERHGLAVEPVPILFAALLNARGHKGPAEIEGKREYVFKDALRNAHRLGVPIAAPAAHPFNPLLALRVSSSALGSGARRRLIDALFAAIWAESRRIDDPAVVAAVADAAGLDGAALVAEASTDAEKARVRTATEQAIATGAWGVPTLLVPGPSRDELFWGLDALPHVDVFLRGEDPVPADALERWGAVPRAASRV